MCTEARTNESETGDEPKVIRIKDFLILEALQYDGYHPNDELQGIQIDGSDVIIRIRPAQDPIFSVSKMEKLAAQDAYISMVFKDLSRKNPQLAAEEIWRPIFNGNILNDSLYQSIYATL
ncbi:hypothetical protein [Paenibacillus sp. FSL P4-0288]|uniref:hypothetical protein n=1 Tax=Paenibacillus sp. FSL P4-0288 TaxID=2921633 RepID=UPI0030FC7362